MNIFEYENKRFPGTWTAEDIKKLRDYRPPERENTEMFPNVDRSDERWEIKPDEYYCWQGSRIPSWFE